jgi:ATP/maltotriose-dependent transcriptional regulator MalT
MSQKDYWSKVKDEQHEDVLANPDNLIDEPTNKPWGNAPPKLARILIEEYMDEQGNFPILSEQENLVLRLYTNGRSLGQIAIELKLSKSTVVTYLKRISKKFRKLIKPLENEI